MQGDPSCLSGVAMLNQEAVKRVSGFESKTVREGIEWIREEETQSLRQLWLYGRMRQALCSSSGR